MMAINNANYTYYLVLSSRARRKRILEGLNDIVGPNLRRDNVSMLDKLSEISIERWNHLRNVLVITIPPEQKFTN